MARNLRTDNTLVRTNLWLTFLSPNFSLQPNHTTISSFFLFFPLHPFYIFGISPKISKFFNQYLYFSIFPSPKWPLHHPSWKGKKINKNNKQQKYRNVFSQKHTDQKDVFYEVFCGNITRVTMPTQHEIECFG